MEPQSTRASMEMSAGGKKKRPPSRLQKQAPATLQLEPAASSPFGAWGDGRTPIPLLSPLIVSPSPSPAPAWEEAADDHARAPSRREGGARGGRGHAEARSGRDGTGAARAHGCNGDRHVDEAAESPAPASAPFVGWRHPALPTPVAEPASLVPFLQSQCALEARNAQQ